MSQPNTSSSLLPPTHFIAFFTDAREPETPERAHFRSMLRQQLDGQRLSEVLEQLRRCPAGLDPSLNKSVRFGVAYHHAGEQKLCQIFVKRK